MRKILYVAQREFIATAGTRAFVDSVNDEYTLTAGAYVAELASRLDPAAGTAWLALPAREQRHRQRQGKKPARSG